MSASTKTDGADATPVAANDAALPSTGERFIPGLGGSIELEHLHRYLFARQICTDKAVLDIACGEGYGSAMLGQAARSVVGVDIADEAVHHARKRHSSPNVRFILGSCAAIPLGDASIDVVVSFETIEHHDEHEAMMREIRRVLRPGGVLVLSSPERFEYSERPGTHNEFHVHELYRNEFIDLVRLHFPHADFYDQKVLFGSTIVAEELATVAKSVHADTLHERSRGLVRPMFLIAVASDAPIPPMETGVFEQQLAETSEWKWWIDTVAQRDERIRALSGQADGWNATIARLEARIDAAVAAEQGAKESEEKLAQAVVDLQEKVAAAIAERDTAVARGIDESTRAQARLSEAEAQLAAAITERDVAVAKGLDEAARAHAALSEAEAGLAAARAERDDIANLHAHALAEANTRIAEMQAFAEAQGLAIRSAEEVHEQDLKRIAEMLQEQHAIEARGQEWQRAFEIERRNWNLEQRLAARTAADELVARRQKIAHLQHRLTDLAAELARKTEQYQKSDAWGHNVDVALTEQAALLASVRRQLATRDTELHGLHHYVAKLHWVLSTKQAALDDYESRLATLAGDHADERARREALLRSTSWRVTYPLRRAKDFVRAVRRLTRRGASHGVGSLRATYRAVPLATGTKTLFKDAFFQSFRFALEDSSHYREWQLFRNRSIESAPAPAASTATAPAPIDATVLPEMLLDDATVGAEPIPQLAEPTTEMTEHATLSPAYSAAGMPLWVADGVAEWTDLPVMRDRIAAVEAARRNAFVPEAVPIVTVSDDEVEAMADSIVFAPAIDPVVTILVPAYNRIALTLECLMSIAKAKTSTPFEIIVADDASTDRSAEIVERVKHVKVHRNATNLHFLRNCNAALPMATGRYVVFLNNDVQVQDGWLDEMCATFERHEDAGAVGPKIVFPSGHLQEAGCAINVDMSVDMVGVHDDPDLPGYNYTRRVDYCSGACLMVSTDLLRTLGGFDEDFAPAYCEDGDLCMRIRERGLFVYYEPSALVVHRLSATTAADNLDDKRRLVAANLATFGKKWQDRVEEAADVRAIAFYLPQYYPFPENDQWWGKGFTEWTNVTKAQPNFVGHYQPHLPADLGFYDLRVARTMDDQAALARRYGLGGFCFYYYWFAGKRLLDLPVERMLETGKPDFPFCLCWANENWTRRWDGQETHVLMAQSHSDADDEAVILDLMRYFRSPNYIRIDGKPLLVIYRVTLFPDFARTAAHWRSVCRDRGIGEIYLVMVESFDLVSSAFHPSTYGCDATIEFPPQGLAEVVPPSGAQINPDFVGHCVDYRTLALRYCTRPAPAYVRFRGAMPGWDNTARRQNNSYCIEHSSPGGFQAWLEHIVTDARRQHFGDERIVFVNAWNEWAEGAHLEPDRRFGHTYLEALSNARDAGSLLRLQRYAFDE